MKNQLNANMKNKNTGAGIAIGILLLTSAVLTLISNIKYIVQYSEILNNYHSSDISMVRALTIIIMILSVLGCIMGAIYFLAFYRNSKGRVCLNICFVAGLLASALNMFIIMKFRNQGSFTSYTVPISMIMQIAAYALFLCGSFTSKLVACSYTGMVLIIIAQVLYLFSDWCSSRNTVGVPLDSILSTVSALLIISTWTIYALACAANISSQLQPSIPLIYSSDAAHQMLDMLDYRYSIGEISYYDYQCLRNDILNNM